MQEPITLHIGFCVNHFYNPLDIKHLADNHVFPPLAALSDAIAREIHAKLADKNGMVNVVMTVCVRLDEPFSFADKE